MLRNKARRNAHKVQIILILEAVVHLDDPVLPTGNGNEGRRLEHLSLSSDVPLLTLSEHVGFP